MKCSLSVLFFLISLTVYAFSKEIRIHREHPKSTNPNGPCSTIIEVDDFTTIEDILNQISTRLQFPAMELRLNGKILSKHDINTLPDSVVVSVFESSSTVHNARHR